MNKNGCWNREPLRDTAIVQSGWKQEHFSRTPVIVMIKDPMSKSCIYQRDKKDDPKCQGCKELEQ